MRLCVPEQERVQVVEEVAITVVVSFHGLRGSHEHWLRSYRHAFAKLCESVVDNLLYRGAFPDKALPQFVVAVPCLLAVNGEDRNTLDIELGRLFEEVVVQHPVYGTPSVFYSEVGNDAHCVRVCVVRHVDERANTLCRNPAFTELGLDIVLALELDDCCLDRIVSITLDGIRVEIDVLNLVDGVEGRDFNLVSVIVVNRFRTDCEIPQPESDFRIQHVVCSTVVRTVLDECVGCHVDFLVVAVPLVGIVCISVRSGVDGVCKNVDYTSRPRLCDKAGISLLPLVS